MFHKTAGFRSQSQILKNLKYYSTAKVCQKYSLFAPNSFTKYKSDRGYTLKVETRFNIIFLLKMF